jgi:hypothetical protein
MNALLLLKNAARLACFLGAVAAIILPANAGAQETGKGYNAFRTVRTRNIFDPQRRAMRTETTTTVVSGTRRPSFFALTGAMVTDDRALAFFSGSQSDYNKVLHAGETIADFKIASVSAKGVELARDGKTISLNVGQQIPLEGANAGVPGAMPSELQATAAPSSASFTSSSTNSSGGRSSSGPGVTPGSSGSTGGDRSEILKRMMERREKEVSK